MNANDAKYRGVRTLVLGGGGFIGRWTTAALHARGAEVFVATRDALGTARVLSDHGIAAALHVVDLSRTGDAARLVDALKPQIVFNLAGYGIDRAERDETLAQRVNCDLVAELAEAVKSDATWSGQALVHAGSALEAGTQGGDFADAWKCVPTTLYGRTKLEGSERLRDISQRRGVKALSARLFTVYGPGEHAGRLLPSLREAALGTGDIPLSEGRQLRDFTFVEDVAEGLLRLGACPVECAPRALNLATGELTQVRDFALRAARELGIARERLCFGALPTRVEEMAHEPVALDLLQRLVGWRPSTTIESGVRRTLAFERSFGRS